MVKRFPTTILMFLFPVVLLISYLLIKDKTFIIDEPWHYQEIENISRNPLNLEAYRSTATLPGYHLTMAALRSLLGIDSLSLTRLLTLFFSLLSVIAFYLISRRISNIKAYEKTLQYFFFPILYIFFFLVYTDVFSLFLLLSSLYFLMAGRYKFSGLLGFLSVLVRQNNVIWLGLFVLYIFLKEYRRGCSLKAIVDFFREAIFFVISFLGIILLVLWNKTPGLDRGLVHPMSIHLDNIFFILFLFFFLFLPLNVSNISRVIKVLKKPVTIFLLALTFIIYILTFKAAHPYNGIFIELFLRNSIAHFFLENTLKKIIFFLPVAYSLLSLMVTELQKEFYYVFYGFSFIFLSLLWLIEPRYYIIPFVFFILFKKQKSDLVEHSTIILWVAFTAWLFWGMLTDKFFL